MIGNTLPSSGLRSASFSGAVRRFSGHGRHVLVSKARGLAKLTLELFNVWSGFKRSSGVGMQTPDAVIIGAGPAGLAAAQRLNAAGLKSLILDKADAVGAVWRRHYDRLHLHTARVHSALPGLPIPASYGRYPSRAQFVDYLESYARKFDLRPTFNAPVTAVRRDGDAWRVEAGENAARSSIVVVATGWADFPHLPRWPGMADFQGPILHSSAYRNAAPYAGKRILVVGFGNSGAEIALDLCEAGAEPTLSVRSPVRVLPRDLFGVPIQTFAIAQRFLPARVADALNAPIIRLTVGSLEKLGLKTAAKGPMQMIEEDGRIPVLDIGAVKKIREGKIKARGAIERFTPKGVVFAAGGSEPFDAVILATGFRPDLRALLPDAQGVLDAQGRPLASDQPTAQPGLYFVGAIASPTGVLREIRLGATRVGAEARRFLAEERTSFAGRGGQGDSSQNAPTSGQAVRPLRRA
jgi:cation diffusion facilitator CzcD-associated flavoprotein CzcO